MAVDIVNDEGRPVRGEKGELVCTKPFPSMPVGFWDDPRGAKYRAAYFERFPGVWCHGDYAELTDDDGLVIHGRSDAVLNPGGVRIGTAEIYRQVEKLDEVVESIAIGQDWQDDVRVVLFVRLRDGIVLDDTLRQRIRQDRPREHHPAPCAGENRTGDRHPAHDQRQDRRAGSAQCGPRPPVRNTDALANPDSLEQYRGIAELQSD
jgi:acetoacetyl-CoA synthetase